MKKIRGIKILLITLILILGGMAVNTVYAADDIYNLRARLDRPFVDNPVEFRGLKYWYNVLDQNNSSVSYIIAKIFESSQLEQATLEQNFNDAKASAPFYCLRGGKGFGYAHDSSLPEITSDPVVYKRIGEMHTDAKNVINSYNSNYLNEENDHPIDETITSIKDKNGNEIDDVDNVNRYNAILWILDESYLPNDIKNSENETIYNEEDYKKELLTNAGILLEEKQRAITKDDIEIIQQLAIWYFTNYDEQEGGINPTVSQKLDINNINEITIANYIQTGNSQPYEDISQDKKDSFNKIYSYFIREAIKHAKDYQIIDEETGARSKKIEKKVFDKSEQFRKIGEKKWDSPSPGQPFNPNSYYAFGPVKIVFKDQSLSNRTDSIAVEDLKLYGYQYDENQNLILKEINNDNVNGIIYEFYQLDASGKEPIGNPVSELQTGEKYCIKFYMAFDYEKGNQIGVEEQFILSKPLSLKLHSFSHCESTAEYLQPQVEPENNQPVVKLSKEKIYDEDTITTDVFDLALRKYVTKVERPNELTGRNDEIPIATREPEIDFTKLNTVDQEGNLITTAEYKHRKDPVIVKMGDIVTYKFTVYNEGDIKGAVHSIIDYLPAGLEFDETLNTNDFIEYKDPNTDPYTEEELEGKKYAYKIEGNKITITPINLMIIDPFDGTTLKNESIEVKFKVTAQDSSNSQILTNVATMTYGELPDSPKIVNDIDRDSNGVIFTEPTAEELVANLPGYKGNEENDDNLTRTAYHYKGQQDDDDFEKIVIKGKEFDLALRKYITLINGSAPENDRTPKIDTNTLINGTFNRNGHMEYTATYEHPKDPLRVKRGDIITYTIRVYNEGDLDGYASEITDYIPEGLALIKDYNTNFNNAWKLPEDLDASQIMNLVGGNGFYKTEEDVKNLKLEDFSNTTSLTDVKLVTGKVKITTNELENKLIKAFDKTKTEAEEDEKWQKAKEGEGGLSYRDLQVSFLVIAPNTYQGVLKNIAEISEDSGNDRDSTVKNVNVSAYEDSSQEDDDDFEPVILKYFDLALRKFITGVETNDELEEVTSRIPEPKLGEDGNIKYNHSKEPVKVASNDIVIYTIRVFNEGTLAGYAEEIIDDIPEGLEYLPDYNINKDYEWVMVDTDGNVTQDISKAVKIRTDYLSEAKEVTSPVVVTDQETGQAVESEVRNNIIKSFDYTKPISTVEPFNPDYKDVKVAFKVAEPTTSDRILTNSAQISKDSDYDEDSIPDEWNEGEDDQDREYLYVEYFDLSLLKWVTKTVVTVDGKTTTTETGFKPNQGKTETTGIRDNKILEPVAKVEVDKKKLNKTTVKFVYKIRVTNEGEIAGYATEVTDFIPEGLEFKQEDNKEFGWVKEGDNKVKTRALETVLLKPGENKELEIVFTWKNNENNLGLKTNIAEITEDYNKHNSKDIDSTPNNKKEPYEKEQEDDDDFALVILSIKTGKGTSYTLFITMIITILAGGIYLIKRYVLTY